MYSEVSYPLHTSNTQKLLLHIKSLCPAQIKSWNNIRKYAEWKFVENEFLQTLLARNDNLPYVRKVAWLDNASLEIFYDFHTACSYQFIKLLLTLTGKDEQLSQSTMF